MNNSYTIRGVVYSYMNRFGLDGMTQYERLELIAMEGVRHMNIFSDKAVKVRHLTVTNGIAELPGDYIDYQCVAILQNGVLITLGRNDQLLHETERLVDNDVQFVSEDELSQYGSFTFESHISGGEEVTGLFSVGTGFVEGLYTIDTKSRKIFVSQRVSGTRIVLQYIAHEDVCGETFINPMYFEALSSWIDWKANLRDNRLAVRERKQQFVEDFDLADFNENMPSIVEIHEAVLRGQRRTPK